MIALIFVLFGFSRISAIEGTQGYMEAMGLPGMLVYLLTAFIFHSQLGDQTQFIMFLKNVAMAGGFLFLARHGAGELSIDKRRSAALGTPV